MSEHQQTLDCQAALEQLYEYIDGELGQLDRAAVRSHLEQCRPCLDRFDFEELFHEYVKRQAPRPQATAAFKQRLSQRLHREEQKIAAAPVTRSGGGHLHLPRFALAASIMLLVTVGAWWMARTSGPPSCDWTKLASIHMHNEDVAGPPLPSLETENTLEAVRFLAANMQGSASVLPHEVPGGMLTHEARVMPWKRHPIGQLEWRCPVSGNEASLFVSHASCLPLTGEPQYTIDGRNYRVATIDGYRAICWKEPEGFVCVMMADRDFGTILAWAEEVRQPGSF